MNWSGKRVLVTGHTGFKGSWLSLWLQQKGANLCGTALEPPTSVNLFENAEVGSGMRSVIADIRDSRSLKQAFADHRPEVVFHLAAQSLVRASYEYPLDTYSTNVMGTANVLEAARESSGLRAVIVVTTDKCYENREWELPYFETDRLGGYDPYSNSKACAELVVSAYRNSFFNPAVYDQHGIAIASVRAGNVIGGGDWAHDRLVPDAMRAWMDGRPLMIRNARAIRPWQHVLEPLRGYLAVAESLLEDGPGAGEAWNFGPDATDAQPVEWVVNELAKRWGRGARWEEATGTQPHEEQSLRLDCSKAASRLGWRPELRLNEALAMTVAWHRAKMQGRDMHAFTMGQIDEYERLAQFIRESAALDSEVRA
jgi:CDP-glucose 4,6-dehydratase